MVRSAPLRAWQAGRKSYKLKPLGCCLVGLLGYKGIGARCSAYLFYLLISNSNEICRTPLSNQVSDKQGNEFIHLESQAFSEEDELDFRT